MKKAALIIGSALSAVVFGYALLAGILMQRVRPVPIMVLPERGSKKQVAQEAVPA
jgi:hypothetical protein